MNTTFGTHFHRLKRAQLAKLTAWAEREAAKTIEENRQLRYEASLVKKQSDNGAQ